MVLMAKCLTGPKLIMNFCGYHQLLRLILAISVLYLVFSCVQSAILCSLRLGEHVSTICWLGIGVFCWWWGMRLWLSAFFVYSQQQPWWKAPAQTMSGLRLCHFSWNLPILMGFQLITVVLSAWSASYNLFFCTPLLGYWCFLVAVRFGQFKHDTAAASVLWFISRHFSSLTNFV